MRLFLLVTLVCWMDTARAWGKLGHEMVANLAYERLSSEAQERVRDILGETNDTDAGSPLGAVADWADRVRYTKEYHWSTPLHFVDVQDKTIDGGCPAKKPYVPTQCHFDYQRDCEKDMCVAGAIVNYTSRMMDKWATPVYFLRGSVQDKWRVKEGLMFVTHFVGDIHQPLHCSRASDKGGNTFHVHFNVAAEMHPTISWNLHSVWDDGIIDRALKLLYNETRGLFEDDLRDLIRDANTTGDLEAWLACSDGRNKTCTSQWGEESLEDALSWAYRNTDNSEVVEGSIVGEDYYETRLPVVKRRLAAAGVRLAASLELLLGGTKASSIIMDPTVWLKLLRVALYG